MDRVDEVIESATDRLCALELSAIAVVVTGSFARGTQDEYSDLDIRAITTEEPAVRYRTWFQERRAEKPLHVSAGAYSVDYWLSERQKPADWSLGFPALYEARYAWATESARSLLGEDPSIRHPPGPAELEDFVELLAKVRRASLRRDAIGIRLYARAVGELAPRLLRSLNDEITVRDHREALDAALSLSVAPVHYREDLFVSLGVVQAPDEGVARAALRLGREVLAFLRERKPDVDPQPDIARYLADGTLERHLGFEV